MRFEIYVNESKFIKIMALTASPEKGEALNAINMANKYLKENNITWEDVLSGLIDRSKPKQIKNKKPRFDLEEKVKTVMDNYDCQGIVREMVKILLSVNPYNKFYTSLHNYKKSYSEKQIRCVVESYYKYKKDI